MELSRIKEADEESKPAGANADWLTQAAMYADSSRDWTSKLLKTLQVGLPNNENPIQVNMLRRVVDRLAVIYDQPPTRWLLGEDGKRIDEGDPRHLAMNSLLARRYNMAWRAIDKKRALHRNAVVRFYASDAKRQVVLRTFDPFAVIRSVGDADHDTLDGDAAFALNVGSVDKPRWEKWAKVDADKWSCLVVDDEDNVLGRPFERTDDLCPYDRLPVQIIYDEWPDGAAWLAPRSSRTTWTAALNATANDLWSMIVHQAHTQVYATARDKTNVPAEIGPTIIPVLEDEAKLHALEMNPKIRECLDAMEVFSRLWVGSEDLPTEEFQKGRQVVTGAALKVQNGPLLARREALVEQAPEDEAEAWERFRGVHNVHRVKWGAVEAPDLALDVEIADVNPPEDPAKLIEAVSSAIAMGAKSRIDGIRVVEGCNRTKAIQIAERVDADNKRWPPKQGITADVKGPRPAGTGPQGVTVEPEADATDPQGIPQE